MREIKFRAWDKNNKRFVTYGYLGHDGLYYSGEGCEIYGSDDDIEVSQFTGLHDKNGKEIYEGDILKGKINSEVVWSYFKAGWCVRTLNGNFEGMTKRSITKMEQEVI